LVQMNPRELFWWVWKWNVRLYKVFINPEIVFGFLLLFWKLAKHLSRLFSRVVWQGQAWSEPHLRTLWRHGEYTRIPYFYSALNYTTARWCHPYGVLFCYLESL
jgi:hypothetical protein